MMLRNKLSEACKWIGRRAWLLLLVLLLTSLEHDGPPPGELSTGVYRVVAGVLFDFLDWETQALWSKLSYGLLQPQRYMSEAERVAFVRDYVARLEQIASLQRQVEVAYSDPQVSDPAAATAEMSRQLAQLRVEALARQPVAEAIVEEQVGVMLAGEGLGLLGRPFPPLGIRFTPLPSLLVVSRRERIETVLARSLEPGLDTAQQESIEAQVDRLDVSSLVTPIGGLSAWPAMLMEHADIAWIANVTAHEWTHHYLDLHPLGWAYEQSQEARTINETTASLVGDEIGRAVLAHYYPDLLPPDGSDESPPPQEPTEPPVFDFRAEMHVTRVRVDQLLAAGQVEEAEQYMEERREFFWQHGYRIRKLNQAYFAFHGSYADAPGARGEDPVGPAVRQLRQESLSLRAFLAQIDSLTSLAELEATLAGRQP